MVTPVVLGKVAAGITYTPVQLSKTYSNSISSIVSQAASSVSTAKNTVANQVSSIINAAQNLTKAAAAPVIAAAPKAITYAQTSVTSIAQPVAQVPIYNVNLGWDTLQSAGDWLGWNNAEANAAATRETMSSTTTVRDASRSTYSAAAPAVIATASEVAAKQGQSKAVASGLISQWSSGSSQVDTWDQINADVAKGQYLVLPVVNQGVKSAQQALKDALAQGHYSLTDTYADSKYTYNTAAKTIDEVGCDLYGEGCSTSNSLLGMAQGALNAVINISTDAIAAALSPISGYISSLSSNVGNLARSAADTVLKLSTVVTALPLLIGQEVAKVIGNIKDMIRPYWEGIQATFNNFAGKVTEVLGWLYDRMPQQIKSIADTINAGFNKLAEAWSWIQTNVLSKALEYFQNPGKLINDVWGYISGKFSDLMTWVSDSMNSAKEWMWNQAQGLYNYLVDNWQLLFKSMFPDALTASMGDVFKLLASLAPQIMDWIKKAAADPGQVAQDAWDTAQKYAEIAKTEGEKMIRDWCDQPLGA